ncbi:MAG: hypothetical protein ACJA1L_002782 [Paracoccaceae bacterium]|jgi:hypothetical protein
MAAAMSGAAMAATSLTNDPSGYAGSQLDLTAFANGSDTFTFGPAVAT